jgi:hypothetical protein
MGGARSTLGRDEKCPQYSGRDHPKDLGVDGNIKLRRILRKQGGNVWTGFIWLKIGTSGGPL